MKACRQTPDRTTLEHKCKNTDADKVKFERRVSEPLIFSDLNLPHSI